MGVRGFLSEVSLERKCACGCGVDISARAIRGRPRKYLPGHRPARKKQKRPFRHRPLKSLAPCACGCGVVVTSRRSQTKYVTGHAPSNRLAVQRAALRELLERMGIPRVSTLASQMHVLSKVWRKITAWTEYAACPPCLVPAPDPMVTGRWFVYGLVDPRTRLIRYVGCSTKGLKRPKQHREVAVGTSHLYSQRWIRELERCGLTYEIVILEVVVEGEVKWLYAAEKWWIAYGRASGWTLTNLTDGGDGWSGKRSEEQRRAMSARSRGYWSRSDYRAKQEASGSPYTSKGASRRQTERWKDPIYRTAMTEKLKHAKRHFGNTHHMRRPEVQAKHRVAMQIVARTRVKKNFRRRWFELLTTPL